MEVELTNNVGRPHKLRGWKPKKWRPEYERMVAMSCVGMSNKMIAQQTGYTPEHVSNILNLEEAERIRTLVLERMRDKAIVSIPSELDDIAKAVTKRLKSVVESDDIFEKAPFAVVDRGLKILEGLGYLGAKATQVGGNTFNVSGNATVLTADTADDLAKALNKSNNVRQLHAAE